MRTLKISLLIFILSTSLIAQWQWMNPRPQGNSLKKICFVDSSIGWIVGNRGTILKTTNGLDWNVNYDDSVREHLTSVTFLNNELGWVVSASSGTTEEGSVFKSTDGGETWEKIFTTNNKFLDVKFINESIGWVVGFGTILKTTDGGMSWSEQFYNPTVQFYSCYFRDSLNGWAVGNSIFHTQDGGSTWDLQSISVSGIYVSISFSDNINGWMAGHLTASPYNASLLRTTDGGNSWFDYSMAGSGLTCVNFVNNNIGWLSNSSGNILKTTDGGNNWLTISGVGSSIDNLFFVNTNIGWLINPKGVICKTTDGGFNWITQSSGFRFNIPSSFFVDSLRGTIINPNGELWFTEDGANTWTVTHYPPYVDFLYKITFIDSLYGWVCGNRHNPYPILPGALILSTTNGGRSWNGFIREEFGIDAYLTILEFVNRQIGFTSSYGIWRTTDGGWHWNIVCPNTGIISDIFFLNSMIGWAPQLGSGIIFKTTDGGNNWEQFTPNVAIQKLFFLNENDGWGFNDSFSLLQTTDGGYNWQVQIPDIGSITSYWISDENNVLLVGGKSLKTTDGGQTWENFWHPANYSINSVQFINNRLAWFTGDEGTILKYYNDEPSLIENENFYNPKFNYNLTQNYPNPFNPVTKIKYEIPGQTRNDNTLVTLKVYDVLGREVATLINEEKSAGEYEVEFNGVNLPTGIYFYQLMVGGFTETRKMVLLK